MAFSLDLNSVTGEDIGAAAFHALVHRRRDPLQHSAV
jgi:hypothetical protein